MQWEGATPPVQCEGHRDLRANYTVGGGFKQKGFKQTTLYIRDEVISATFISRAGHCGGWPKGSSGWGVAAFKGSFWGAYVLPNRASAFQIDDHTFPRMVRRIIS